MKSILIYLSVISILFASAACSVKQADMDVEKVKEEINSRKIRRVTDAEIVQAAYDSGKTIIEKVDLDQTSCNESINLENELVLSCSLVCDDAVLEDEKEKQIWSAYQYNFENGLEMADNIQKSGDAVLLYTLPITVANTSDASPSPKVLFLRISRKALILTM